MTDASATLYDVRSCDRPASVLRRLGVVLARHMLLAAAAVAAVGLALAGVTLTAGWLLATLHSAEPRTIVRKNFGPRSIALVPRFPGAAGGSRAADIVVFPPTLADIAAPVRVAKRTPVPRPVTVAPLPPLAVARAKPIPLPPKMPPAIAQARAAASKIVVASVPPTPPPAPESRPVAPRAGDDAAPSRTADIRTAIYDISAHLVYLPNGRTLEAHSGLGNWRDDPRYVAKRMRGPTPPNTYELSLRERLFHGVRAIRLTPVDDDKMFGRAGMLAHTYMLGPDGDSNGCVSFKNYRAFLEAYLKGDVDRLIVVPRHGAALARIARARAHGVRYAANEH